MIIEMKNLQIAPTKLFPIFFAVKTWAFHNEQQIYNCVGDHTTIWQLGIIATHENLFEFLFHGTLPPYP